MTRDVYTFAAVAALSASVAMGQGMTATPLPPLPSLDNPTFLAFPPGDDSYALLLEKVGRIRRVNMVTGASSVFLLVTGTVSSLEGGLLGIALHPDFQSNGYFYVYYSTNTPSTGRVITRYRVSQSNPLVADPASATIVLFYPTSINTQHLGGWLGFGPDGYLYASWGESSGGTANLTTNLLGKILRLDVDGPDNIPGNADDDELPANANRNYCIPPDNPFVGINGEDEIWAYGLRNPWRASFDSLTGEMYIADVGAARWDEINVAPPPPAQGGRDYGWPCMEGGYCFNSTTNTGCCPSTAPALSVRILQPESCAVIGGYVYRGCAMPWLQGLYIFGDYCSGRVFSARYDGTSLTELTERTAEVWGSATPRSILSFSEDRHGELYMLATQNVGVFKLVPAGASNQCGCGTSDFNGDGDFGTDQDIEAFFACLGGNCCPTCSTGGSDFNGDGDYGTDQDIEAFFRVLGGGYC